MCHVYNNWIFRHRKLFGRISSSPKNRKTFPTTININTGTVKNRPNGSWWTGKVWVLCFASIRKWKQFTQWILGFILMSQKFLSSIFSRPLPRHCVRGGDRKGSMTTIKTQGHIVGKSVGEWVRVSRKTKWRVELIMKKLSFHFRIMMFVFYLFASSALLKHRALLEDSPSVRLQDILHQNSI